jgi:hypothetical protein
MSCGQLPSSSSRPTPICNASRAARPTVKRAGANCPGSCRSALVHPLDIAAAAVAGLTTLAASGWTVRYVASDERTPDEVAQVLGAAIGQHDLRWVELTDAQMLETLVKNGLPAHSATGIVDLYISLRIGQLSLA